MRTPVPYVFVPLVLVLVAALAWSWLTARSGRDPASSVDSFNRALSAMQPGARRDPAPAADGAARADDDHDEA